VLDPIVVTMKVSTTPAVFEPTSSGVDLAEGVNEVRQVTREVDTFTRVCL